MIAKVEVLLHVDDIVSIIFVFLQQSIKDLHFYQSLAVKSEISHDMGMVTSAQGSICISANTTNTMSSAGGTIIKMFHSTLLTTVILISYC